MKGEKLVPRFILTDDHMFHAEICLKYLVLRYDDCFMLPIFSIRLQLPPLFTVASRYLRPSQVEVIDAMRAEETISIVADAS